MYVSGVELVTILVYVGQREQRNLYQYTMGAFYIKTTITWGICLISSDSKSVMLRISILSFYYLTMVT